jgi:hypothetical protein
MYLIGQTCLDDCNSGSNRHNEKKGEGMKKACLALALLLALALNARATTGTGTVPINGTVSSSCLSEPVAVSGIGTFVFTTQQNSDGTFTGSFNFHFQAQGIGLNSGSPYSVVLTEGNTLTLRAFAGIATEFIETFAVNGSGGHSLMHSVVDLTINHDGTVTVSFVKSTTQCWAPKWRRWARLPGMAQRECKLFAPRHVPSGFSIFFPYPERAMYQT